MCGDNESVVLTKKRTFQSRVYVALRRVALLPLMNFTQTESSRFIPVPFLNVVVIKYFHSLINMSGERIHPKLASPEMLKIFVDMQALKPRW